MDVFVLNDKFLRENIIDRYESLVWADRYNALGDFELTVAADNEAYEYLIPDTKLTINGSDRVMVIEDYEDVEDEEGRKLYRVSGRSLEKILDDRVCWEDLLQNLDDRPKWILNGLPANLARNLYEWFCRLGYLSERDELSNIPQSYPEGIRIPEPSEMIRLELTPDTLLKRIQELCQMYDLGFKISINHLTGGLNFQIYTGWDRTSIQSANDPVIFSADTETLQNTKSVKTIRNSKNVAYVIGNRGTPQVVYAPGVVDANRVRALQRRVLLVVIDDIDEELTPSEVNLYLKQRGVEELSQHRGISGLDGEIVRTDKFRYLSSYDLGDLVEMRGRNGEANRMLVTEHIWTSDESGVSSFPTLTLYVHVEDGTWLSWPQQRVWSEMETDTWGELP